MARKPCIFFENVSIAKEGLNTENCCIIISLALKPSIVAIFQCKWNCDPLNLYYYLSVAI